MEIKTFSGRLIIIDTLFENNKLKTKNMRKILFRAKRKDNSEWIKGCLTWTLEKDRYFIREQVNGIDYDVIPETIGQFTGFYDKVGEELYEGDVVLIPAGWGGDYRYETSTGVIEYDNGFYVNSDDMSDFSWNQLVKIKNNIK